MSPLAYRPVDAATGWTYSLTDPLLPLHRRAVFEDAMAQVAAAHPRWTTVYLAGAVTSIAGTLPADDPWRHLRARVAGVVVGESLEGLPPGQDGVVGPDGQAFGTWRDATDLLAPVFDEPESDPQLAALADPLPVPAGAVLAAAGRGDWRLTAAVLTAAVSSVPRPPVLGQALPGAATLERAPAQGSGTGGYLLRDVGRAALVWAIHRRRAYVGWDDPVVLEALLSWASRAGRVVSTEAQDQGGGSALEAQLAAELDRAVVEAMIREAIPADARQDLEQPDRPTSPAGWT